ncbi:MAG: ATP-binding protein [Nakamurella sp.]
MSFWVPPSLRYLCDGNGEFTASAAEQLVTDGMHEGDEVDFKSGLDPSPDGVEKFLAEVVAFANHRGGLLIWGIRDEASRAVEVVGMREDFEVFRQKRTSWLARRVAPIVTVEVHQLLRGDQLPIWVISVPPSPRQPHAIRSEGSQAKTWSWPVRDGDNTRYLTEPELADRYDRRFRSAADRRRSLADVARSGVAHLTGGDFEWVYLALTPESPAQLHADSSRIKSTRDWLEATNPTSVFDNVGSLEYRIAPRRVQAGSLDRETMALTSAYGTWIELYQDGSAFVGAGCQTSFLDRIGTVHAQEVAVVDGLIFGIQVAGQWAIQRCGAWGSVDLIAGTHKMPAITRPQGFHQEIQHPKTDTSEVVRDDISSDLSSLTSLTGRLSLCHQLATELLQWYGLERDVLITDAGRIDAQKWGHHARSHAERWAGVNAVLHEPDAPS